MFFCCRSLKPRRLVYSEKALFICFENEEIVRDKILMSQVENIYIFDDMTPRPTDDDQTFDFPEESIQLPGCFAELESSFQTCASNMVTFVQNRCSLCPKVSSPLEYGSKEVKDDRTFIVVSTKEDGFNSGRTYYFLCKSEDRNEIFDELKKIHHQVLIKSRNWFENSQATLIELIDTSFFQRISGVLIIAVRKISDL